MSFSSQNIADRMLANDIKSQMLQVERNRVSDESRLKARKAFEQVISPSKPCTCNCHSKPTLTDKEIEEDREWRRNLYKETEEFIEKVKKESSCAIL